MDLETALVVFAASEAGRESIKKLLGPTAEYLGCGARDLVKSAATNVARVMSLAIRKLGNRLHERGSVPPRVVQRLLTEAPFIEDPVCAEYFAGVLACSRTRDGTDDQGIFFLNAISRLSTIQLRTHYTIYSALRSVGAGRNLLLVEREANERVNLIIAADAIALALNRSNDELLDNISHILYGLGQEQLVGTTLRFGSRNYIALPGVENAPQMGLRVSPSSIGADLFVWAHGQTGSWRLCDPAFEVPQLPDVNLPDPDDLILWQAPAATSVPE
jgi:hypothetical protein